MDAGEYRAGAAAHGDVVERNARLPVEHYSVHIGLSVDRKADRSAGTAEITGIAVKPVVELRFVQDEGSVPATAAAFTGALVRSVI